MSIKIYQNQIRPTEEVSNRASTSGMKVSMETASAPGRALSGMLKSGEKLYVKYEDRKSRNSVLKAKDQAINGIKDNNGNVIVEGLNMAKEKAGNMTDIKAAEKYYNEAFNNMKSLLEPDLNGIFAKRIFNNTMTKLGIVDKNSVKINSYRSFIAESKTVELKSLEPDIFNAAVGTENEKLAALANLALKFNSADFKELFGDKAKLVEFQTYEGIDVLEFSHDLEKDAIETFSAISAKDQSGFVNYKNLSPEKRMQLINTATNAAQSKSNREINNYYASAKIGETTNYSKEKLLKPWIGTTEYDGVYETLTISDIVRDNSIAIKDANYGEEFNVIENIEVTGDNLAFKEKAKKHLEQLAYEKYATIKKDAAGYYIENNEDLKLLNKEISLAESANNFERTQILIEERSSLLETIYNDKQVPKPLRKFITKNEADSIVSTFNSTIDVNEKINFLLGLGEKYGGKMPEIYNQLQDSGLPPGATVILSTNDRDLQVSIAEGFDVKSLETNIKNTKALKQSDLNDIKVKIGAIFEDGGYGSIVNAQPKGSEKQVEHINGVVDSLYQATLYKMFNENMSIDAAVKSITKAHAADYTFKDTYWIPNDINGTAVNRRHIEKKADYIIEAIQQTDYLDKIDLTHYGDLETDRLNEERSFVVGQLDSKFEKLTPEKIQEIMVNDIKNNGKFYLNENGDGLLLYVTRSDGSFIPIMDRNGNKIEMSFLDVNTIMPITNEPFTYNELDILVESDMG